MLISLAINHGGREKQGGKRGADGVGVGGRTARAADTKGAEKGKKERRFSLLFLSLSLSCGVTIKFAKTDTLKVWRGRGLASNRRFPRTVASSGAVRKRKGGWTERRGLKSPPSSPLFATGAGAKSATHAPKETAGERKGKGAGRAKHIRSVLIEESRYPLSLPLSFSSPVSQKLFSTVQYGTPTLLSPRLLLPPTYSSVFPFFTSRTSGPQPEGEKKNLQIKCIPSLFSLIPAEKNRNQDEGERGIFHILYTMVAFLFFDPRAPS